MIDCASPFLNCPRCGLSIRLKVSPLTVEYCPRCMARARIPVQVVLLHALPRCIRRVQSRRAGQPGVTTTIFDRS